MVGAKPGERYEGYVSLQNVRFFTGGNEEGSKVLLYNEGANSKPGDESPSQSDLTLLPRRI